VARSPVGLQELELLKATLLLGDDDLAALRRSGEVLAPRVEEILDVWYGLVGANLR
jgi:Protoglobin